MTDEQDLAEQLDEDSIGDDPKRDDLPGVNRFVDVGPMSSEDPTVLMGGTEAIDSDTVREWREEPDTDESPRTTDARPVMSLLDETDSDEVDTEPELLGRAVRPADGTVGPEDAALHLEPDH